MLLSDLKQWLLGGLIVSCQALEGEPLFGANHMAAMAHAAVSSGAVAIRANTPVDIQTIRQAVDVPIIGLYKVAMPGFDVYITPTLAQAIQVAQAGADLIAIDATQRPHPGGRMEELIAQIHQRCGLPVLADVATLEDGLAAVAAGAEFVSTTLSGYTEDSPSGPEPDFSLLAGLVDALKPRTIPVIAEGRITSPGQAAQALRLGAHAVVVGSAITRPQWITARFVEAMQKDGSA